MKRPFKRPLKTPLKTAKGLLQACLAATKARKAASLALTALSICLIAGSCLGTGTPANAAGTTQERTYKNETLKLVFKLPSDWSFADEATLKAFTAKIVSPDPDKATADKLVVPGFYATGHSGGSVCVLLEDLALSGNSALTASEYLAMLTSSTGGEWTSSPQMLGSDSWEGSFGYVGVGSTGVVSRYALAKRSGDYVGLILIVLPNADSDGFFSANFSRLE